MTSLSPFQSLLPQCCLNKSYDRIPITCDKVRSIIAAELLRLSEELEVPDYDYPIIDAVVCQIFQKIRDGVTHPFRDDHLRLILRIEELEEQLAAKEQLTESPPISP